jgi:predicted regulator of Ras-like GTPase activity (Roadblock/LC7/MglB family)
MPANQFQDAALQQLSAVPGVVGSMVFDPAGAVVASRFPAVFDPDGLRLLAEQLSADGYFQDWVSGEGAALDLRFGDGHVVVRALEGAWLLVLCTLQVNAQLLSMSLTQVLRRLRLGAEPGRGITGEFQLGPPPAAAAVAPPAPSALERLRALVTVELGPQAPQALEILAAAGASKKELEKAVADVEKLTRMFISKKKAEELGRKMAGVLENSQ